VALFSSELLPDAKLLPPTPKGGIKGELFRYSPCAFLDFLSPHWERLGKGFFFPLYNFGFIFCQPVACS
jgi:hypothetical protein